MAYCNNCGAQLAEGAKFCPKCGNAVGAVATPVNQQSPQQPVQPQQAWDEPKRDVRQEQDSNMANNLLGQMNNTADTTAEYDPKDIEANKAMALLSYFGILVLIPIFGAKDSKFARFHANQGLTLCLAAIVYGVAYSVLTGIILAISWRLYFLVSIIGLVSVVFLVLAVIGIINAVNGKAKELPLIGKINLLK